MVPVSRLVLLNFVIILLVMVPSFRVHVSPKVLAQLGEAYYSLAMAYAALGGRLETAKLRHFTFLLSSGTNILPQQFRLTNYNQWAGSCPRALLACARIGTDNLHPLGYVLVLRRK